MASEKKQDNVLKQIVASPRADSCDLYIRATVDLESRGTEHKFVALGPATVQEIQKRYQNAWPALETISSWGAFRSIQNDSMPDPDGTTMEESLVLSSRKPDQQKQMLDLVLFLYKLPWVACVSTDRKNKERASHIQSTFRKHPDLPLTKLYHLETDGDKWTVYTEGVDMTLDAWKRYFRPNPTECDAARFGLYCRLALMVVQQCFAAVNTLWEAGLTFSDVSPYTLGIRLSPTPTVRMILDRGSFHTEDSKTSWFADTWKETDPKGQGLYQASLVAESLLFDTNLTHELRRIGRQADAWKASQARVTALMSRDLFAKGEAQGQTPSDGEQAETLLRDAVRIQAVPLDDRPAAVRRFLSACSLFCTTHEAVEALDWETLGDIGKTEGITTTRMISEQTQLMFSVAKKVSFSKPE